VQAISIKADELAHAPKLIKIAVNNPHIGFDDIESANEPQVAQVLELTEEQVTNGSPIPLRFVRFQAVLSLHVRCTRRIDDRWCFFADGTAGRSLWLRIMVVRMRRESTLSTCLVCLDSEFYTLPIYQKY